MLSPGHLGAASGKMITDKHLSNLNSALGENFFPKGFILIPIHLHITENISLLILLKVFFANTSDEENRYLSNLTKLQLCAVKHWVVRIEVENLLKNT